jgi:Flp pilus assembly pilin Flp
MRLSLSQDRTGGTSALSELIGTPAEQLARGEDGQGLAEYALILGLIAIVAIISLVFLGDTIADLMSFIGSSVASTH